MHFVAIASHSVGPPPDVGAAPPMSLSRIRVGDRGGDATLISVNSERSSEAAEAAEADTEEAEEEKEEEGEERGRRDSSSFGTGMMG